MSHYFRIEKSGCCEHNGLMQVRVDVHKNNNLTAVQIIPKGGYPGEVDSNGIPVNQSDFNEWFSGLPTEEKNLPIHTHFIYFEPTVTNEEILFCGEIAKGWKKYGVQLKNTYNGKVKPDWKLELKSESQKRIEYIKVLDFTTVENAKLYSVKQ